MIRRGVKLCRLRVAFFGLAAVTLAGCGGMGNGAGSFLVDPGRYDFYHCNDLAARWKILVAREKELRGLIERADQSAAGAVVASLSYRTDYESVLSEERLVQKVAADKNCDFRPMFQSDQGIR